MNNKEINKIQVELQNAIQILEELNYKNKVTLNQIKKNYKIIQ
jgi:hypothetical protein